MAVIPEGYCNAVARKLINLIQQFLCCSDIVPLPILMVIINHYHGIPMFSVVLHGMCRFYPCQNPASELAFFKSAVPAFACPAPVIHVGFLIDGRYLLHFLCSKQHPPSMGIVQNRPALFWDLTSSPVNIKTV